METFGDWLEFVGTVTTAIGLVIAWEKATGRLDSLREGAHRQLLTIRHRVGGGRSMTIQADTAVTFGGTGELTFQTVGQHVVEPNASVQRQIEGLAAETRVLRDMIVELRKHIEEVETSPRLEMSEVNTALEESINKLESELNISSARDFRVAIGGMLLTVVGLLWGLAVDGGFSWLPWL
ncbi:hypothetical protein IU450_13635 [Nocardia abscessus]|uniref:hypothetical protein n=1 Tax=Nocardia abscessus TaxID=120957 RepID=UPI001895022E|nr:hypothetical protein [Nocardia abscessus]MBF6336921.1 hypothetical protein [Nocardia abscessus]